MFLTSNPSIARRISVFSILAGACFAPEGAHADPPPAPEGWQWQKVESLTDEFDDDQVDEAKWWKKNPYWVGRAPGLFKEAQVTEGGGFLRLKNSQAAPTTEKHWVHTGFLASKGRTAVTPGMYIETRMKCAKDGTVAGFWFSQPGGPQEIDVQEGVGFPANGDKKLTMAMRMNTHYVVNKVDKKTPQNHALEAGVGDAFHTHGVWWKDKDIAIMYCNGKEAAVHEFGGEFTGGMQLNLNTETQDWIGDPSPERLKDDKLNTTLFDYVRTWVLVTSPTAPATGTD